MSVHTVVSGTEYYITLEAPSRRRNKILKLSQRNQPHQHRPIKTQIPFAFFFLCLYNPAQNSSEEEE